MWSRLALNNPDFLHPPSQRWDYMSAPTYLAKTDPFFLIKKLLNLTKRVDWQGYYADNLFQMSLLSGTTAPGKRKPEPHGSYRKQLIFQLEHYHTLHLREHNHFFTF